MDGIGLGWSRLTELAKAPDEAADEAPDVTDEPDVADEAPDEAADEAGPMRRHRPCRSSRRRATSRQRSCPGAISHM
jgi:hypothetical protein